MAIEWLDSATEDLGGAPIVVYSLDKALSRYEVRRIGEGYLVLNRDADGLWVKFAVLQFCCSDCHGGNVRLTCVFHGEGPSGNLRECRHTWWGDDGDEGYLFYPNGPIITKAFKELAEFFDEMIPTEAEKR